MGPEKTVCYIKYFVASDLYCVSTVFTRMQRNTLHNVENALKICISFGKADKSTKSPVHHFVYQELSPNRSCRSSQVPSVHYKNYIYSLSNELEGSFA